MKTTIYLSATAVKTLRRLLQPEVDVDDVGASPAVWAELRREFPSPPVGESLEAPAFVDPSGETIELGTAMDGGDEVVGKVVDIVDCDENGWAILIKWPEYDEPERVYASAPWPNEADAWRVDDFGVAT